MGTCAAHPLAVAFLGFHFVNTPHEKLYTVRVDHDGERVRHDVHPWRLVGVGCAGQHGRHDRRAARRSGTGLPLRLEKVEEEVARLTARYGQEAEGQLREEIQTVELDDRQLIEEEKSASASRRTRNAAGRSRSRRSSCSSWSGTAGWRRKRSACDPR